jgi:hypothetical protein
MKSKLIVLGLLLSTLCISASAQGTAFMYQGHLIETGNPANGLYDIRAGLYAASSGGALISALYTNSAVPVSNGLFTITMDFGDLFNGTPYWLQIGVRTNGAGAAFAPLSPRQELTPTPYAIFAEGANAAGLTGTISGNGGGLTNVDAGTLGGLGAGSFWHLGGNSVTAGQFIGTTDSQPLDLYADNIRALRLILRTDSEGIYTNAPNVIGGSSVNAASASYVGETIGGGGGNMGTTSVFNSVNGDFGTISGGAANLVAADFAIVGGGYGNIASFPGTTVGGGYQNIADSSYSTVSGGFGNHASGYQATTGGGSGNSATGSGSTVGGGFNNAANGTYSTVPGGNANIAGGYASFAAGQYAQTTHNNTFIWGDGSVDPFTGANFDDGFNVLASGGVFFFHGVEGVHIDYLNQNNGAIDYGLHFGAGSSGEGMASKRTAGGNQYGLDFYTSSANRMSIANGGFVGINTTSPSQRLEVNGNYVLIDGGSAADGNGPIDAYIGGNGSGSDVQIGSMNSLITSIGFWNTAAGAWMHIACSSITINGGSDLAEPFAISSPEHEISQGAVLVIDDQNPGHLKISDEPYDTRVAGVVSGANGIKPGIQMQQQGLLEGGKNVALTGRVYVQADASNGPIKPGDLLTTSSTPGHAMKVTDHAKAQGAILGKAMTELSEGKGMVLVLVTLQ